VLHWSLAFSAVWQKCQTFDEVIHVTGGYSYWVTGDYRLNPEAGMLAQRLMALPLLAGDYRFPPLDQEAWRHSRQLALGRQFFFEQGNPVDAMLRQARATMAAVSTLLGLAVYLWSRRLFGPAGGMLSLLLYALSPPFLANGPLATVDVTAALCFLLAVGAFWALLQKLTLRRLAASTAATAALFVAKMSAVLLLPMMAVLLALRLAVRRPLPAAFGRERVLTGRAAQAGVLLGAVLAHAMVTVFTIWLFHGFRYSAFRATAGPGQMLAVEWLHPDAAEGLVGHAVTFARERRWLPEAYLCGFLHTFKSAEHRSAFLNGRYSLRGWWWFFPYCLAVKTPLPVFAVLVLAAVAAGLRYRESARGGRDGHAPAGQRGMLYRTAPLWTLLAVYWASALTSHLNIGHRHILPTYPPMFILAGAAVWLAGRRWVRPALAALVAALAVEAAWIWPDYLAYFNQLVGGPRNGYKHLVDSSLDWGQDLPALKRWLDRNVPGVRQHQDVYLSYFGTASPEHYGVEVNYLPRCPRPPSGGRLEFFTLEGGVYCISATMLQQVVAGAPGPWVPSYEAAYQLLRSELGPLLDAGPAERAQRIAREGKEYWGSRLIAFDALRLARLCAFLRQRRPDDWAGYSILIYRLSDEEVRQMVEGPAPPMADESESPYFRDAAQPHAPHDHAED